ncbi:MAG: hypothetical protein V4760_12700 [Bdellovibrionota bacterium]
MRHAIFAVLLALAVSNAQAATCFTDVTTWNQVKAELPEFLQSEAFYATHESSMMLGAFTVAHDGARFRLEGHGKHVLAGTFHDVDVVKQVCVDGANIQVALEKGGADTITQVSGGLKIRGYKFQFTTKAAYDAVVARVPKLLNDELSSEDFLDYIELY